MMSLSERIAGERRRLRQVRECLTAATHQGSQGNGAWVPFYIAIGDYFEAAMGRLHEQDMRMDTLLRAKVDLNDPEVRKALVELDERLAGNQQHLTALLSARDGLRAGQPSALSGFEQAGRAYADYIVANMGHHPGSTNLAQAHFRPEDWQYMATVSEADQLREEQLFAAVFADAPSDLQLPDAASGRKP